MEDIEVTMTNVRKAYRLLAVYQKKILDIVQDIAKEFNYDFYRWEPQQYVATNEKKPPFSFGGWGMLPMYNISFLYLNPAYDRRIPQLGEWLLEIKVEVDEEYEEANYKILSPLKFKASAEESNSHLGLFAMQLTTSHVAHQSWYNIWDDGNYYPRNVENVIQGKNYKFVGNWYDTSELLVSKESFQGVIANFKGLLVQHEILQA